MEPDKFEWVKKPGKLYRTKRKETCPCCCNVEKRWLYSVHRLWYCVECLKSCFGGRGPARIQREC